MTYLIALMAPAALGLSGAPFHADGRQSSPRPRKGATTEEIMEALKLCGALGVDACELGAPILADELARSGEGKQTPRDSHLQQ